MEAAASGKPYSPGAVVGAQPLTVEKDAAVKLTSGGGKADGELDLKARKLRAETVSRPGSGG